MRRFILVRDVDVSGISGEGTVVWGIEFPDGVCAYRWNSAWKTTCIADSIADIIKIHGHEGATRLVWLDTAEASDLWRSVTLYPVRDQYERPAA
ncbi:hypothetical protein ACFY05_32240 [Microtetraspora fusca]|uniref:Integron Cassette Protein Hfx-Cass5 domain-containing protein n=1 Tax=Microtetraspora fusca TaxID=1997 RepID=A0ABW6VE07_MICFU